MTKIVGLAPSSGRWTSEATATRAATVIGADSSTTKGGGGGWTPILIVVGISTAIYVLSPGARHFYKHGHLPAAPDHEREHEHERERHDA